MGTEPEDIFLTFCPRYARLLKNKRGERRFFGAKAINGKRWQIAAVSQQDRPAVEHRLEVYSHQNLREDLRLQTGDKVVIEVLDCTEWLEQRKPD